MIGALAAAGAGPPAAAGPGDERAFACGLLALDKPVGVTSHDVVEKVRRRLRVKTAGHLGTLDPGASGLLLIALGPATRCIPAWQGGEKTYEGVVRFGVTTSTQDLQGEVVQRREVTFDAAAVREASHALVGEIAQVPPMVSALHHEGERLYRLARRGLTVERVARAVRVASWEWKAIALPEATFRVRCSSGTYVRTLVHDLGEALGSGGALAALRRLRSEPFGLERAVTLRRFDEAPPAQVWTEAGWTLEEALGHLPTLSLDEASAAEIGYGRRPAAEAACLAEVPLAAGPRSVVFRDPRGRVLGLGEVERDPDVPGVVRLCPHVVLPWALRLGRPPARAPC